MSNYQNQKPPDPRLAGVVAFGQRRTYREWEQATGIARSTIHQRIKVSGLPAELALSIPSPRRGAPVCK